ncbi:MAG: hypothetical protein L0Z50_14420 [Verrucomicrobiales bacterium]|nr:hypothetical protein [Verrucomicrobiales bacterium]
MTAPLTFASYAAQLRALVRDTSANTLHEPNDAAFNELAVGLFSLQFDHVPVYRRFCEARQAMPASVHHWNQIPALPVAAFKEFEISSLHPEERTTAFHSSGTTGQKPSRHFHSPDSLKLYETSLLHSFRRHLLGESEDRNKGGQLGPVDKLGLVILAPSPTRVPHSSLAYMFEAVRRQFGSSDSVCVGALDQAGAWTLDLEAVLFAIHGSICAKRPIALLGTAFSFVHLLDHLAAKNLRYRLAEGSRVLETGGYKGRSRSMPKNELHNLITEYLGVPETHVVCEYGMSELSSQAYDQTITECGVRSAECGVRQAQRVFFFPPWARVRLVSPETGLAVNEGEAGLIRVFDLANVQSVLAIETEDLGRRRGDGFELLGRTALAEPRGCSLLAP